MNSYERATVETLEALKKAGTEGIFFSTALAGYDLSGLTSLVPVNVPARNNTAAFPREIAGEGSENAVWRALLNQNSEQPDGAVGRDYPGAETKFEVQSVFAPYIPIAHAGRVTLDAVAESRNFADALAVAELQVLNQVFISQDQNIINGQAWPLVKGSAEPEAPTLEFTKSAGEIKEGEKLEAGYVARSGNNYFVGGGTKSSKLVKEKSPAEEGTGALLKATAIKGAVAYDWYLGKESGKLWYIGTTTVSEFLYKGKIPTEAAKSAGTKLPLLYATLPVKEIAEKTTDTSYSEKWYNGVIASNLGAYGASSVVNPEEAGAVSSGAVWKNAEGKELSASGSSITIIDEVFEEIWEKVQLSPTSLMCNSYEAEKISALLLEGTVATTFLPPTDADARTNLAGGGYVGRYVNKAAGGVPVAIEVHPRVAPGTIIARTDRVPYPGSNIGSTYSVRCQYDTMKFNYAAAINANTLGGGPRYDFEVRSMETLVNRAPNSQAVIQNIKSVNV